MKQIIDGKRYDTDTATEIAATSYRGPRGDFAWFEEALYKTKRGSWFLAGRGNAASKYATSLEGGRTHGWGSGIRVLTSEDARRWLEAHEENDALEEHFGESIADA